MKFHLRNLKKLHGRLGTIYDVERLPSFKMDTPNLVFYTKVGCIPHLTEDALKMVTTDILPLQFPLENIYHASEAVEKFENSLQSFVGLPEYFSYCILQDPTTDACPYSHRQNTATIWPVSGKQFICAERYMELMESFQPDMYVSLCDGDTNIHSSKKRIFNSLFTTNEAFKYCFNHHVSSPVLSKKGLIAAVEGGYDLTSREKCAQYLSGFPVLGYLIDGLYSDGKSVHTVLPQLVENIISHTVNHLPEERLRIVHGAWEPKLVLKMIKLGIDLFDTSFPYLNTEKGWALTFNFNVDNLFDDDVKLYDVFESKTESEHIYRNGINEENECKPSSSALDHKNESGDNVKGKKILEGTCSSASPSNDNNEKSDYVSPYSISLYESRYFDDLTPLLENCTCLACQKYTKAYVHHLLTTKEMLARILLTIHNLHHYIAFFSQIREQLNKNNQGETVV